MPAPPAILVLEDGSVFHGIGIGIPGIACGEVVFNTAMTGYQEILTDPSYARQLITLTYPHIGNVGACAEDAESRAVFCAGLIIRDTPKLRNNWRAQWSLSDYLKSNSVVGISGIDTRKLTRLIRTHGAPRGCIVAGAAGDELDTDKARAAARAFPGLTGMDLAKEVSAKKPYKWTGGEWQLGGGFHSPPTAKFTVAALDYGVKHNLLRLLAARGCEITVLPAQTPADEILAMNPDGVFLSNGPGDPAACDYAIRSIRELLARKIPLFGICLGHQLMALAGGAQTMKMKFGHHGANHPVRELAGGRVFIASQNHGFTVREDSLPDNVSVTHRSLFDGSVQGLQWRDAPAFSFQGHPEASPGPHDIQNLFDAFIKLMENNNAQAQ